MAPHPPLNASSTLSPNLSSSPSSQLSGFQPGGFDQSQWSPDAIGTVLFGVIMFFIGVAALWQGRRTMMWYEEDEEQSQRNSVVSQPTDIAVVEMTEFGSERVAVRMDEGSREDDIMEQDFVNIGRAITDGYEEDAGSM